MQLRGVASVGRRPTVRADASPLLEVHLFDWSAPLYGRHLRVTFLKKLRDESGIPLDAMMFIGDAIFPGGNDYPAKELGLDTVRVRDPEETISVITAIVACQK